LENGERHTCDAVISNNDAVHTYQTLLGINTARIRNYEASCSGFVLCLGVKKTHPQLAHHNIFFSSDYENEFAEIFNKKIPPREPTIYVSISAKTDVGQAPEGCENWFILVNAPYLTASVDWDTEKQNYRDLIINRLKTLGFTDLEQHIEFERIITPKELNVKFNSYRGSIYGISSNQKSSAFLRPQNRSPYLKGLYLASGSAHPGGGTPMVTLSGKFAAELLMKDFS
jgi:phytoene desaturase